MPSKSPKKASKAAAGPSEAATEAATKANYVKVYAKYLGVYAPAIALAIYYGTAKLITGQEAFYAAKFEFLNKEKLGWIYFSWVILYLARVVINIHAYGARSATGIDRPDQHAYEAEDGSPVRMSVGGATGRFNRAQRAVFNMDETLPFFLVGLVLTGYVFGPVVTVLALVSAYGRVSFAGAYTHSAEGRGLSFRMSIIPEITVMALVALCAVRSIALEHIPTGY